METQSPEESRSAVAAREHIFAHLARLDFQIRREVLRLRLSGGPAADDQFRGLYISDEEVEALLSKSVSSSVLLAPRVPPGDALDSLEKAIANLTSRIEEVELSARQGGHVLTLVRVAGLFGLSQIEQLILVLCLAAEVDLKYERLYAYLQDDVTRKRPTVDLALRLLCPTVEERLAARKLFEPGAPLLRWELISLHDDPGARRPVLLSRYLKLDERIAGYLLGSEEIDSRLAPLALEQDGGNEADLPPELCARLARWAASWHASWTEASPVILFHGRYGTGKMAAARFLASSLGGGLLPLNASDLPAGELGLVAGLKLAEREALLRGAVLCWAGVDGLTYSSDPSAERDQQLFLQALARGRVPTVLLAKKPWEPSRGLMGRPFLRLELADPGYVERRDLWAAGLDSGGSGAPGLDATALAGRFRLTAGQIRDAVGRARTLAWARDPSNGHLTVADVDAACRTQAQHRLGSLARKLEPHYSWDDIVLPRSQLATLRLISTMVRHRTTVYGDWGFDRKLAMGKGIIALFAGPSGTGKTMSAGIIGRDLGLDLYKIDLSSVVSKYIGETEKNLEKIFSEAQESDAILFFDEADALFGKRSEVKDAHDRYANIEIAYLLQRTEEYNGLVILASNVKKNMDEAFVRRLHFAIDFPFPEEAERLEIWRRTFPPEAPRDDDLDLPFLARKLRLSGGNIRNVVLTAAFLAAEEKEPIAMRHLVRGAGHEFQKMGKLVVEGDFEQYFEMAKG